MTSHKIFYIPLLFIAFFFPRPMGVFAEHAPFIPVLFDIHLPTNVSAIIGKFGPADKVEVPTQKELAGSPEGQWFRWWLKNGVGKDQGVLSVLGDEYSLTPNTNANVRFISYMALQANYAQVLGEFKFNTTSRKEVEAKFKGRSKMCWGKYNYKDWPGGVLKVPEEQGYTYFFFSPNELLVGVAQSTFDMDTAS